MKKRCKLIVGLLAIVLFALCISTVNVKAEKAILGEVGQVSYSGGAISWSGVSGADGYEVFRYGRASKKWYRVGTASANSYTIANLQKSIPVKVKVRAFSKQQTTKYTDFSFVSFTPDKSYSPTKGLNRFYSEEAFVIQNKYRKAKGKKALVWNEVMYQFSGVRAKEIVKKFDHTRPDGSKFTKTIKKYIGSKRWKKYYSYAAYGENIAYGQKTSAAVMTAWKNSSGHYANIMAKAFRYGAISCYIKNGTCYWVSSFQSENIK